jgi:endonuclease YncB( thermonuclease family)
MSTIFNKRFATQEEIDASGDENFIARCRQGDNITIVIEEAGSIVYLTYFADNNTVSIVKKGELSPRLRAYSVRVIKKAMLSLPDNVVAWVVNSDSRTKRLLRLLGFTFDIRKVSYDMYRRRF